MWKLTIVDDEGKRTDLPLSRGEYNVGRDEENTVRLTDRNISRKHLVLRKNGNDAWIVEDLNSYNGCFVNGLRVSETHPLQHGDLLQLGDYRLELFDESVLARNNVSESAQTVPAPTASRFLDRPDRLVVVDGDAAGTEFPLEGEKMTVGRAEDAEISINHSSVSRIHAEIVMLEGGRYEIVDRGSSNGVRVNGIKLERRAIEDDDEIELGDVRLRFVAKGRIFRPGAPPRTVSVSPTSAASTTLRPGQRKSGGFGIVVAAGAVLGLIVVGGVFALTRPQTVGSQVLSVSGPTQIDPSSTLVTDAQRLLAAGDVEGAHGKVNQLPDNDTLRTSPEVKAVEASWADSVFQRAAQEVDIAKRRVLLGRVSAATLVDQERRRKAADMLHDLDTTGATNPDSLPAATQNAATAGTASSGDHPLPNGLAPNPFDTPAAKPSKDGSSKTATPSAADKPKDQGTAATPPSGVDPMKTALDGNDGPAKARKMLEPKVWSGRASPEEIKMLIAICRQMHDSACVSRARQLLQDSSNKK